MSTDHAGDTAYESWLTRLLLAVVRIGVAFMWIQNVSWKDPSRDFSDLRKFVQIAVDEPVWGPYAWFAENIVLENMILFGWLTLFLEAAIGACLLVGLATRFWAVVGLVQAVAITLSVIAVEWPWSYYLMIMVHLVLFATAAGRYYGVDGALRPTWQESDSRIARVMVRLS